MNIGERKTAEAITLRTLIYNYLRDNLGVRATQVADNFDINQQTAGRHMKAIRDGWKPAARGGNNG